MKIPPEQVERWRGMATEHLARYDLAIDDVTTGMMAWDVAFGAGMYREVMDAHDRSIKDAHVQTALGRVFPRAVFRDPKRY